MISRHFRNACGLAALLALAAATAPVHASGELPILRACLAKAAQSPDQEEARNQCVWQHWSLMAEYGK